MRLAPLAIAFGAAFAASPVAWAQLQLSSSQGLPLSSMATGAGRQLTTSGLSSGLKLGEEALLHAGLFADVGYDTNVFYSSSGSAKPAAVLHLTPRLELTNAERDGSIPQGVYYDLHANVDFRKYLTSDSTITQQDALNPSVGGTVELSSGQTISLSAAETFSRYQQAPYSPGTPITRDGNMFSLGVRYAPGGGRLKLTLRYNNVIDKYEGFYNHGSNMGNEVLLDGGWGFLPKTALYAQASQGVITYFYSGNVTSYPLRTLVGIRGLITEKLSVNLAAGYYNAFYQSGDTPSGWGNLGVVSEINFAMSLLSRMGLGYRHDFANSPFVGGYYNMDAVYGVLQQLVASRVMIYLFARYENRRFGNQTQRSDNYLLGGMSVDYVIGNFFLLGASYTLHVNQSDVETPPAGTPPPTRGIDYAKHVLLVRIGAVY